MLVSCCNVICFSCPTCSSEGKHLFPPLQLPLQFENMSLPSPWNKPSLTSCHPSHCFSLVISSCSTFSWSAVPTAGYHLPRKAFYYHMRKEDHVMYLTDYIPVHTFHNFFFFFFPGTGCPWIMFSWWLAVTPRELFCASATPAAYPVPSCICSADCCFSWSVQIRISQINFWIYWIIF